ncbi:MAG: FAD-dependent thymidylate synthase [Desulfuromonadia bacterium]
MHITLLKHTDDPERTVELAARLCYSATDITALAERIGEKDSSSFLEKILALGHHSVLEHVSYTFGIEGISRACSHQLVRHRIASYSQQSQRYVTVTGDRLPVVTPPTIADDPVAARIFQEGVDASFAAYQRLVERGVPPEDARFILPNAAETRLIVTMNARELRHFFSLRCCERAQWEIRRLATRMLSLVKPTAPVIFADAGPGCVTGPCPEGAMSCGRSNEIRKKFKEMA